MLLVKPNPAYPTVQGIQHARHAVRVWLTSYSILWDQLLGV